jgi:hypothetical protein
MVAASSRIKLNEIMIGQQQGGGPGKPGQITPAQGAIQFPFDWLECMTA